MISTIRWLTLSSRPPMYPAETPKASPTSVPKPTEAKPTNTESRAPCTILLHWSRPRSSVPNQWSRLGPWRRTRKSPSLGSAKLKTSAPIARTTMTATMKRPIKPMGWRRISRHVRAARSSARDTMVVVGPLGDPLSQHPHHYETDPYDWTLTLGSSQPYIKSTTRLITMNKPARQKTIP